MPVSVILKSSTPTFCAGVVTKEDIDSGSDKGPGVTIASEAVANTMGEE